jgi:hypothetical protein
MAKFKIYHVALLACGPGGSRSILHGEKWEPRVLDRGCVIVSVFHHLGYQDSFSVRKSMDRLFWNLGKGHDLRVCFSVMCPCPCSILDLMSKICRGIVFSGEGPANSS